MSPLCLSSLRSHNLGQFIAAKDPGGGGSRKREKQAAFVGTFDLGQTLRAVIALQMHTLKDIAPELGHSHTNEQSSLVLVSTGDNVSTLKLLLTEIIDGEGVMNVILVTKVLPSQTF